MASAQPPRPVAPGVPDAARAYTRHAASSASSTTVAAAAGVSRLSVSPARAASTRSGPDAPLSPAKSRASAVVAQLLAAPISGSAKGAGSAASSPALAAASAASASSSAATPYSTPTPASSADPHLLIRRVCASDYSKGHCDLLAQLTTLGAVSEAQYIARLEQMQRAGDTYHTLVIEDTSCGRVIGTATLVLELKFVHACGAAGHIEDVVISKDGYRGKNLGARIVQALHEVAKAKGCYKIMLDCSAENAPFYVKLGYRESEKHMRCDL